jgi:type I restriction enzyme S subunit
MECGGNDAALAGHALGSMPTDAPSTGRAEEGELPEGWRWAELQEVVTAEKEAINPLDHPDELFAYYSIPAYQQGDNPALTLGREILSLKLLVEERSVLFGKLNPRVPKVWLVSHKSERRKIASTEFIPLLPKAAEIASDFLYYLCWSGNVMPKAQELVSGSTPSRQRVDASSFLEIRVPVPPLPEQRAIAAVLRTVQEAKEACERVLAATRQLKQSLLHRLFAYGPIPLAHAAHVPLKETEIGEIPEGWDVVRLAELIDIKHGYAFKGEFFAPSGKYVLLTPGHFHEGGGFRDQRDKTKYYTGEFPGDYLLQKDDLLVAMTEQTSGLLGSAIMVPESGKFLHNQRLGLILNLNESRLDKLFLYYWFAKPDIRSQIEQTATGTKVHHTSPSRIRDLLVALPEIGDQREIAAQLWVVDAKLAAEESRRSALAALFQSLLHYLMTGQVRVLLDCSGSDAALASRGARSRT